MEQKIIEIINRETGLDISSTCRKREYIEARAILYSILRNDYRYTYLKLAEVLGNNHATIIHSVKNYEMYKKFNHKLCSLEKKIRMQLGLEIIKSTQTMIDQYNYEYLNNVEIPAYDCLINLNELLNKSKDTQLHQDLIERLNAIYEMNKKQLNN